MAYPFKPLSTEKLKKYFKKLTEDNCNNKETNQHCKKALGMKLKRSTRVIEAWIQREIKSKV